MSAGRQGLLMGVGAYALWGLFPLYWPFLEPAGALEILAHRVVWSAVVMVVLVVVVRRVAELRRALASPRTVVLMAAASAVIGANWGLFIWGVNNDHVIETSLGYFINPLVTVLLGVFVLGERLQTLQWAALGLAAVAVAALTVDYGRPPWLALALAGSFGAYGLIKKTAGVGAVAGLTVETLLLAPVALGFLVVLGTQGEQHFTGHGVGHALLLTTTGLVTAVPLLLLRGRSRPHPPVHPRTAAVPHPDPAVPARAGRLRRTDAGDPLDRVRADLDGPRALQPRVTPAAPVDEAAGRVLRLLTRRIVAASAGLEARDSRGGNDAP